MICTQQTHTHTPTHAHIRSYSLQATDWSGMWRFTSLCLSLSIFSFPFLLWITMDIFITLCVCVCVFVWCAWLHVDHCTDSISNHSHKLECLHLHLGAVLVIEPIKISVWLAHNNIPKSMSQYSQTFIMTAQTVSVNVRSC